MAKAVVALGSNLPGAFASSEALLEAARRALDEAGLIVSSTSTVWRSAAWPDPRVPEFRNQVVLVETVLSPAAALTALLAIEQAFGRVREEANAARTLDLDLVDHDGSRVAGPDLALPHPRAHERLFVMGPLAEIAPGWVHPTVRRTAAELARSASVGADARPLLPRCNIDR